MRSILVSTLVTVVAFAGCATNDGESASNPEITGDGGLAGATSQGGTTAGGASGKGGASSSKGGSSAGGAGASGAAGGGAAGAASGTDPCATQPGGSYCGETIGGTPGMLYICEGHVAISAVLCEAGCVDQPGGGDVCQTDAHEPCFDDPDGTYCGESIGGKANTVYVCAGHVTTSMTPCPGTCADKAGGPSYCETDATEPCFNDPDGTYCGSAIGAKQGPNNLYVCDAHATTSVKACANGCVVKTTGADVCQSDANEPCFNDPDGTYCGASIGGDPAWLFGCKAHATTSKTMCPAGCQLQSGTIADTCKGDGKVSCGAVQWWNASINYGPYVSNGWWDTDLHVTSSSKVQLRHDSKLIAHGVYGWGFMPTFIDQKTGKKFRLVHLRPQNQYTTTIGKIYAAGTIVGLSGGDTADTGKPKYSTGAHLCVQTVDTYPSCFPKGTEPCK